MNAYTVIGIATAKENGLKRYFTGKAKAIAEKQNQRLAATR